MSRREKVYAACRPHGSRADSRQLGTSRCLGGGTLVRHNSRRRSIRPGEHRIRYPTLHHGQARSARSPTCYATLSATAGRTANRCRDASDCKLSTLSVGKKPRTLGTAAARRTKHGQFEQKRREPISGSLLTCVFSMSSLVAGACSVPKPPDLPFRYRLPVKRRIPLIPVPPNPAGGFEPPALGL